MTIFTVARRYGKHAVIHAPTGRSAASFDSETIAQQCAAALNALPDLAGRELSNTNIRQIEDVAMPLIAQDKAAAPKAESESDLQKKIVTALERLGVYVDRINSGHLEYEGRHIQMGRRGTPDLLALLPGGRAWFTEVKTPQGRVSEVQAKRHEVLRSHGAIVDVLRSPAEALARLAELREDTSR